MEKHTLVMGASLNPSRYSHKAITSLRNNNLPTYAYGLREGKVMDVTIDTHLKSYNSVDTVTLYLGPKNQEPFFEYIIGLQPKRVIFNPGTENQKFYDLLEKNKIKVEVACTLVLLATNQF